MYGYWVVLFLLLASSRKLCRAQDDRKGFYNHTGCLYAHMNGGNFHMITAEGDEIDESLELDSLKFEKSRCLSENETGKIGFSFKIKDKSKIKSISIAMRIFSSASEGFWEVSQANLTWIRADKDKRRTIPLGISNIYAGSSFSYSCSKLVLVTQPRKRTDNETTMAQITIERFQLQPFPELEKVVFAPSFDCAKWISIPGAMGLILVLFMTLVTVIGTIYLQKIETNDFKYNKEGLLFTQSQMELSRRQ